MRARAAVLLAFAALAARGETALERGKRVAGEALEALGGSRYLEMRDRVETGRAYSFYREQLSGLSKATIYTSYATRPEPPVAGFFGQRERQALGNDSGAVLLTGDGGWEITFRGARPMADDVYNRYRDSTLRNVFYILRQRMDEPGLSFYSRGSDLYENQPVEIVEITDAENRLVKVYFSRSTKLPVRQVFERRNPVTKQKDEEVTIYSKYRDVDGVKWPFAVHRERNGEKIFEIFSETVTINGNLKDDLFTLPASMKVLPKPK